MRKLLKAAEVADKLGRSVNWFMRSRADLFRRGFPRPLLGDAPYGRPRWDEGAIDAWLDSQMQPELRALRGTARAAGTEDYTRTLEQRLAQMDPRP